MVSELQKRKLTAQFRFNDTDGDGFVEQEDFERIAHIWAEQRGYQSGTPEYAELNAMAVRQWQMMVAGIGGNRNRLSLDDFIDGMSRAVTMAPSLTPDLAAVVFDAFDADEDGRISLNEYRHWFTMAASPHHQVQAEDFTRLDTNGDGYLSREEFAQLLTEFFGDDPDAPGNWLFGPY